MRKIVLPLNSETLEFLHNQLKYNCGIISRIYHVSSKTIRRQLDYFGIEYHRYLKRRYRLDTFVLINMYTKKKMSPREIANHFEVSETPIRRILKENNVLMRNQSQAHKGKHHSPKTEFRKGEKHRWKGTEKEDMVKRKISESRIGFLNPNWQGGIQRYVDANEFREIRKIVLKRDKNICQLCGNNKKTLQVHHLIPYRISEDNSLENLISLCPSCHGKVEQYYRKHPNDYMRIFYEVWNK